MKITLLFFTLTCITFVFPIYSQGNSKQFNKIMNASIDEELKEQKLDSFFNYKLKSPATLDLANCYHDYGLYLYRKWRINIKKEQIKKVIFYTEQSLAIKKYLCSDEISRQSIDKTLFNLAFFNFKANNYFFTIDYFEEFIDFGEREKKPRAYIWLAISYAKIGDFHKALNSSEKAIALSDQDSKDQKSIIDLLLSRADIYSIMGYKEYSDEIKLNLGRADSILNHMESDKTDSKNRIYQAEGNRLLATGNYQKAIVNFSKTLKSLDSRDSISMAMVYNSIGLSLLYLKEFDLAISNLNSSIKYDPKYTPVYENMGDLYIAEQSFMKALLEYQKAISYTISNDEEIKYDDLISKEELEVAVNKYYLLHHLIQKAKGWVHYYHFDKNKNHLLQALKTFKMADQLVDIIRFESTEYKSKLFWREQSAALYMKAVETSYLLDKPEEAYYFMEKNKAVLLLEDITNEQAKENAKIPEDIAKREYELKQAIYFSENELNLAKNQHKDSVQRIKDTIYEDKRMYEKFVDSIADAYPEYAVNKKKIEVLPYDRFTADYISDQEVVLQYILNKDKGYGLLTTTNESVFFEIEDITALQKNIFILQKQSSDWLSNEEQLTAYHKNAHAIFRQLVPSQVYKYCTGKKITIVPDDTLQQISFDVLTTSTKLHSYFIKDTEIRYAYSMSYLDRKRQIQYVPKYPFIGFAPVTFTTQELGDLALSKDEVISISDVFNGEALVGEKATTTNFLDTIHQFKVIHLSTHADTGGVIDPWIAFSDKKLSLKEIYATKNQSDMVVLSACKTSMGELKEGEGVMSLARGFFRSGTKSVISSLWATNDKASQELMIDFYKEIHQGATKATALRNAKLNYINSHSGSELSPFYWGALILIGNNDSIDMTTGFSVFYWIGMVSLILIILIFLIKYYRKAI